MKFFMLSKCGEGAGLLKRIQDEGNDCKLKIIEKEYSPIYDGILKKSDHPDNGAIIIVDFSGMGEEADSYRRRGFSVFGGSQFADELEHDRDFGFDYMKANGIQTPDTKEFKSFPDGTKYVQENKEKKLVFKPSGDNLPCKLTYCAKDSSDMLFYMSYVEKYFSKDIKTFILQDFIEGALVSTEVWVGKKSILSPANHTVEAKKFLNDDLGPSTGCQGNLVWIPENVNKISELLFNLEDSLIRESFLGCIDLNAIVNEQGVFGLEWTPRFGLDAMPTLLQLMKDIEVGRFISDICQGTVHEMNGLNNLFAGGIRLTIPPYPAEPNSPEELEKEVPSIGIPIRFPVEHENNFYFYEIKDEEGQYVHAAGTGVIAVISESSDDHESCFDTPYHLLEETILQDKQYRTDLKEVLSEMYCEAMEAIEYVDELV